MATQTLPPTGTISQSGWNTWALSNVDTDDSNWQDPTNNTTDPLARLSFDTPDTPPTGTQTFEIEAREFEIDQAGNATVRLEVWETGGVSALHTGTDNTLDGTATLLQENWDASILGTADGSAVEVRIVVIHSNGPDASGSVQYVQWVANIEDPAGDGDATLPEMTASATGSLILGSDASVTLPAVTTSSTAILQLGSDASATLGGVTASATGHVHPSGDGAATLPGLGASGSGSLPSPAAGKGGAWFCCCNSPPVGKPSPCPSYTTDNFNRASLGAGWTTVAGSFSIVSNELSTGTGSGVLINATAGSTSAHVVEVKVKGSTSGDQARIIVAYQDSSNYLYAQLEFGTCGSLKLFKVVGGTHTQIGPTRQLDGWTTGVYHDVRVCYLPQDSPVDGILAVMINKLGTGDRYETTESEAVNVTGTSAGVGTGTVTGTIVWDDWVHQTHQVDDALCFDCDPQDSSECAVHFDYFDGPVGYTDLGCKWSELVGDWEVVITEADVLEGHLTLGSTANALLQSTVSHPRGYKGAFRVQAIIDGFTEGDQPIVILNYKDADNYLFAKVTFSNLGNGKIELFRRVAGADGTAIATINQADYIGLNLSLISKAKLTLCLDEDDNLSVIYEDNQNDPQPGTSASVKTTVATTRHTDGLWTGLGTRTNGGDQSITFDGFVFSRLQSTKDPDCPPCASGVLSCPACTDDTPARMELVLSGFAAGTECNATECAKLNGTFVMTQTGGCQWISQTPALEGACNGGDTLAIILDFDYDSVADETTIDLEIGGGTGTGVTFQKVESGQLTCQDIDGLDIPFVSDATPPVPPDCAGAGASAAISKLP